MEPQNGLKDLFSVQNEEKTNEWIKKITKRMKILWKLVNKHKKSWIVLQFTKENDCYFFAFICFPFSFLFHSFLLLILHENKYFSYFILIIIVYQKERSDDIKVKNKRYKQKIAAWIIIIVTVLKIKENLRQKRRKKPGIACRRCLDWAIHCLWCVGRSWRNMWLAFIFSFQCPKVPISACEWIEKVTNWFLFIAYNSFLFSRVMFLSSISDGGRMTQICVDLIGNHKNVSINFYFI